MAFLIQSKLKLRINHADFYVKCKYKISWEYGCKSTSLLHIIKWRPRPVEKYLASWHYFPGPSNYNFSYLQGESPSSFQQHGDDGDKSVSDSEVEHEVVDIGTAPGNIEI